MYRECIGAGLLLLLMIWAISPAVAGDIPDEELQHGICVRVVDGDTIWVHRDGDPHPLRVRLYGIDCPERRQPWGREARDYTARLVLHKRVTLEPVEYDRYGRLVAWVSVGTVSVNRDLLRAGMAWWYRRYARQYPELGLLEAEARHGCRGLWCMCNGVAAAEP